MKVEKVTGYIGAEIVCGWQYMLDQLELFLSPAGSDWSTRDVEMERIYWRYRNMPRLENS